MTHEKYGTSARSRAPLSADYHVILSGVGAFEIMVATRSLGDLVTPETTLPPLDPDTQTGGFAFSDDEWRQVVRSHLDWLFDEDLIGDAADFLLGDDPAGGFGLSPDVRAAIAATCGL